MTPQQSQRQTNEAVSQVDVGCPKCGAAYRVAATLMGRRFQCRKCSHVWRWGQRQSATTAGSGITIPGSDSRVAPHRPEEGLPVAGATSSSIIDMSWAGKSLGRYKLKSVLGRGGMGVVWRATDPTLNRDVAVKILTAPGGHASNGSLSRALFLQEARAAAKLNHPGAITVFEIAEDQGCQFIAMELMEGGMLRDRIESVGPYDPRELFRLMVPAVRAMALAHARGIIHRDVKPGNLMFDDHGQLKLGDFGLSDVAGEAASVSLRGRSVGSLGWVAPETARGESTTASSDIYAMGLVLLYALTGKPWLAAESRSKLLEMHQNPPELVLDDVPGLTDDGKALLHRCLARDPADRFASADELATFMDHCANEPDEPLVPESQVSNRNVRVVLISIAIAVVAIALSILFIFGYLERLSRSQRTPTITPTPKTRIIVPEVVPAVPLTPPTTTAPAAAASEPSSSADRDNRAWPGRVDESKFRFIASKAGRVYHTPTCDGGRQIFLSNLESYKTATEAEAAGKKPCPHCKPVETATPIPVPQQPREP